MYQQLKDVPALQTIVKRLQAGEHNVVTEAVSDCFAGILCSYLAKSLQSDLFIIASSDSLYRISSEIDSLKEIFSFPHEVILYPEDDSRMYHSIRASKDIAGMRARAYKLAFSDTPKIIVTDINAVVEKIPDPEVVRKFTLNLSFGSKLNIEELTASLSENGYERVVKVEGVFEYSVRGSILDIFPPDAEYPVRIELFGDEVESLRLFSADTNSSTKQLENISLFLYNPSAKSKAENKSIIDYFDPKDTRVILLDFDAIKGEVQDKISKIEKYIESADLRKNLITLREAVRKFHAFSKLRTYPIVKSKKGIKVKTKLNPPFNRDFDTFFSHVSTMAAAGYAVYIVSENEGETKHIKEMAKSAVVSNAATRANVNYIEADIIQGCEIPEAKLVIISNREIFQRYQKKQPKKTRDKFLKPVHHYTELKEKDFVVHRQHGIAMFDGVKTMTINDITGDFLLLRFLGDDKLYLPIYKIDVIDKYIGAEGAPKLSKLGTSHWRRTKEEIQAELKRMAAELLKIYASREMSKGVQFPKDDEMMKSFEDAFIYTETDDQAKAIEDVKSDMMKDKQMDRLVCGDPGFGKTEVAMRAAFKAISGNKQVLVMAATTLLAQQHASTFSERFADYPVKIAHISRLVKAKQKREAIAAVKRGSVDILIGTHAVLSSKIEFANLGLIIVDEEQHFGVKAKESLRQRYPHADVLTLTATPIPRTLYFSLSGIRHISMINTPPRDKKPVETFIVEERMNIIKEIILREVLRKGQVFYVHNNIHSIFKVKDALEAALPEVRFRAAHGRMEKAELETLMIDFLDRKYDVLITTTIIESGLDMPDVNTIVISNAERFGLSQLYQLRGRVGRRDRQAYAYLMVKDTYILTDTAKERLKTIESYVDPGAGFRIAMKDLELRGAGNILGTKQHGNMEKIGFELYCRMLEEEVNRLTGEVVADEIDTKITVRFRAFIPEDYIWDSAEKVRIYRSLFVAKTLKEIETVGAEMKDAWGEAPAEAKNILTVAALKIFGRKFRFREIIETDDGYEFLPDPEQTNEDRTVLGRIAGANKEKTKLFKGIMNVKTKDVLILEQLFR